MLSVFITAGGFALYVALTLSGLDSMRASAENRLIVEDSAGNPLFTRCEAPSVYADEASVPKMLRQAVIAIEDQRFYDHGAVNVRSVVRAPTVATRNRTCMIRTGIRPTRVALWGAYRT